MLNNGIATEIYSLINDEEVRPTTTLVISKCSAYDYLDNSIPNLEKLTTQYYDTFSITSRFTGYFSNLTIGDFYNNLSSKYSDFTAVLGGLNSTAREENSENQENVITNPEDLTAGTSSIVGVRGTENFGIAVFNEDTLCGELSATESICHSLLTNNIDVCVVSINDPFSENDTDKMQIQLFPQKKSNINVDIKGAIPYISVGLTLDANILTLNKDIDYETDAILSKISDNTKDYLRQQFDIYFNKVSKEYAVDIDNFNSKARAHFKTISDWENYNWDEKYSQAQFYIDIDINVLSSILITKT